MSLANNIIVISEKAEDGNYFRNICRSGLLRDVDNIICANHENGFDFIKKYLPDTIVIYIYETAYNALNICKQLKSDNFLKNIPVLLILEKKNDETVLSAYDEGITDYIIQPASDTDILVRLMWCLKRNESSRELEKKEILIRSIGVIDKETEAFTPQYTEKAFTAEINVAKKYGYPAVAMVMALEPKSNDRLNYDNLSLIVKNSIRARDLVGHSGHGKIYLFLPKTNIKGACTVYNKVLSNMKNNISISAGVCEFKPEMNYHSLIQNSVKALEEAFSRGGNKIIVAESKSNEEKTSGGWLNRIQSDKKEYKNYKEILSYKFKTIVEPVFYRLKSEIEMTFKDKLNVEYYITDSKCVFDINIIYENDGISIKIIDSGVPKVNIEVFDMKSGQAIYDRIILPIEELEEEKLNKIIHECIDSLKLGSLI